MVRVWSEVGIRYLPRPGKWKYILDDYPLFQMSWFRENSMAKRSAARDLKVGISDFEAVDELQLVSKLHTNCIVSVLLVVWCNVAMVSKLSWAIDCLFGLPVCTCNRRDRPTRSTSN